ncbi:hypothetical protein ACFY8Q_31560 [[Kitasatospora] papulosa]|uniref:hypothetical protein n=1 Tax=[Kitasatospora] papulosa TaxID=1464011 RepID=UPI00368EC459
MDPHLFPNDLIRAQREWHDTYRALAAPRPRRATELRRRLIRLSTRIQWHPFWSTPAGTPAARAELKRRTLQ